MGKSTLGKARRLIWAFLCEFSLVGRGRKGCFGVFWSEKHTNTFGGIFVRKNVKASWESFQKHVGAREKALSAYGEFAEDVLVGDLVVLEEKSRIFN